MDDQEIGERIANALKTVFVYISPAEALVAYQESVEIRREILIEKHGFDKNSIDVMLEYLDAPAIAHVLVEADPPATVACVMEGGAIERREIDRNDRTRRASGLAVTMPILKPGERVRFAVGDVRPHILGGA